VAKNVNHVLRHSERILAHAQSHGAGPLIPPAVPPYTRSLSDRLCPDTNRPRFGALRPLSAASRKPATVAEQNEKESRQRLS